jgi:hypothetical protein
VASVLSGLGFGPAGALGLRWLLTLTPFGRRGEPRVDFWQSFAADDGINQGQERAKDVGEYFSDAFASVLVSCEVGHLGSQQARTLALELAAVHAFKEAADPLELE